MKPLVAVVIDDLANRFLGIVSALEVTNFNCLANRWVALFYHAVLFWTVPLVSMVRQLVAGQ